MSAVLGLSPDGTRVPGDRTVDGKHLERFEFQSAGIYAYTPDGSLLLRTYANPNPIPIWDTKTRKLKRLIYLFPDNQVIVFSPAGEVLFATPKAQEQLLYIIEGKDGSKTVFSGAEFHKRVGE